MTQTMRMGLRFRRSQKRVLRDLIQQMESLQPENFDIGLFRKALESVEVDEPLVVICDTPEEVKAMADGFALWGIVRPAVEELNG